MLLDILKLSTCLEFCSTWEAPTGHVASEETMRDKPTAKEREIAPHCQNPEFSKLKMSM